VNTLPGTIKGVIGDLAQVDTALGMLSARNPRGMKAGDSCLLFIRPEHLRPAPDDLVNRIDVNLERRELEGAFLNLQFRSLVNGQRVVAHLVNDGRPLLEGQIAIGFSPDAALVLPVGALAKTGREHAL
jgi:spermidine/putrescine transport system ATP-binding protein